LHVVNGSLAQLVERPKHPYDGWIADSIRSVSRGFESRRNHEFLTEKFICNTLKKNSRKLLKIISTG